MSELLDLNWDVFVTDAFITIEQADALVDWVAASGKNLTTIYVTHGHGVSGPWRGESAHLGVCSDRAPIARPLPNLMHSLH